MATAAEEHLIERLKWWKQRWSAEHDDRIRLEERAKRLEGETRYLRDEVQRWSELVPVEGND